MVTLNWDKIWAEYNVWLKATKNQYWTEHQKKIQELVQAELENWLVRQGGNGCC